MSAPRQLRDIPPNVDAVYALIVGNIQDSTVTVVTKRHALLTLVEHRFVYIISSTRFQVFDAMQTHVAVLEAAIAAT